ncbi:GNAT family N-acetyltransferase [Streptomyces sp. NBC_00239]|uniref:GNAT family N-acetyltransferase n=1 Tax=Streptomyces sp. NBC_00239 TaxID=2903640 RepID=UPI002E2E19D8|nr:GNAT family N-acetyltransferase [Streptomyces sp. NBC_00239]
MTPEELPFVVAEHRKHFPDGFFARLGPAFLTAYSRTYISSPHAGAYIAESDGEPVGFLVGVIEPVAHRRHVLQVHRRKLLLRAAGALALRPPLALHFLRTRLPRYCRGLLRGRPAPQVARGPRGTTAVLAHVAVVEHARSRGIGEVLISRFVEDANNAGCARVSLVTVLGDGGAGMYYERRGWVPQGETSSPDGRRLATYDLLLNSGAAAEAC